MRGKRKDAVREREKLLTRRFTGRLEGGYEKYVDDE